MRAREMMVEFYDPADDNAGQYDYDDTRRPRLTLRHLHKLRLTKDTKAIDQAEHLAFLPSMYNQTPDEGSDTL